MLIFSIFFSGCAFETSINSKVEVQPNQKQALVYEAVALFCPNNKNKSEAYYKFNKDNICLWPSRGHVSYGYELIKIIPVGTEVKLIRFFGYYGLMTSYCNLIVQLPTVYGDKKIIIPTVYINQLLGLKYSEHP